MNKIWALCSGSHTVGGQRRCENLAHPADVPDMQRADAAGGVRSKERAPCANVGTGAG